MRTSAARPPLPLPLLLALAAAASAGEGFDAIRERMQRARERVYPALVHIVNVEEYFAGGRRNERVSTGSGFFVDAKGRIVTNFHVAGKAQRLYVTLANRTKVPARLVAGDAYTDLALLEADPAVAFPGGTPAFAELGDSDRVEEGDFVLALGSPLSLARTISFGIVSCRDRALGPLRVAGHETGIFNTWIQTDAAINPGNSGGPLVDLEGRVIGVNTRAGFGYENIGFAIPSNVVREVLRSLLERGRVVRAYVGVTLQRMDEFEQSALAAVGAGVLVADVAENSPAWRAGLRPGFVLVRLRGEPFAARFEEELPALYRRLAALPVGERAVFHVRRPGTEGETAHEVVPEELGRHLGGDAEVKPWGLTVRGITRRMAREMSLPDMAGVMVTGVRANGPAGDGRLQHGDVIRTLDGRAVDDLEAFERLAAERVALRATPVRIAFRRGSLADVTVLRPDYDAELDDESVEPEPGEEEE
jgi:serine protease Do